MISEQLVAIVVASATTGVLLTATTKWHGRWTSDFEDSGVQKHHRGAPPRVGFFPILVGVLFGIYFLGNSETAASRSAAELLRLMLWASVPVVFLGLADDVTKKVPPRVRLLGALAAGSLAIMLLELRIERVDLPLLDALIAIAPVSMALTLLMVCGFTNAMNIIDGLNGLAGGLALLMFAATAAVAVQVGDAVVVELCVVLALSLGGFLLLNFPRGLMFLGDGGAYFLGFVLVQIWLLLLHRNPSLSPWFVMAVAVHPTMETVFSIVRRRFFHRKQKAALLADRLHLHSLVYRRRALPLTNRLPGLERWVPNALASVLVACFGGLPMLASLLAPTSVLWSMAVFAAAILAYLLWFRHLVLFRGRRSASSRSVPENALQDAN